MEPAAAAGGALGDTLAAFAETGRPGAPLTTREVADATGCSRRTAYDRLERLAERGAVETKKVGARGRVWWRPPWDVRDGFDDRASPAEDPDDGRLDGRGVDTRGGGDGSDGGSADADVGGGVPCGTDVADEDCVPATVLDTADVAVFVLDDEYEVAWANRTVEQYFGLDRDAVVGRDKRRVVREAVADVLADGDRFVETVLSTYDAPDAGHRTFECRVTPGPDREERWLEHRSRPVEAGRYAGGRVEVYYDVTERREYGRELEVERDRLKRVLETSPNAIAVFGADGTTVTANAGAADLLGVPPDDVESYALGDRELRDASGDVLPYDERPIARVLETGRSVSDVELQFRDDDGSRRWMSIDATPLSDESGRVTHVVATATEVTRLKEQSRRLARRRDELEHELDEVFERIDDAFLALDDEWRFTYVNDHAETLLDRSAEDLLGREAWEAFDDVDADIRDRAETAMETLEPTHFEAYRDELDLWADLHLYPSESGVSVYFHDVTERKERERELEQYRTIVETVDDGIYVLDDEYHFTEVNDAYCELTGYDREQLLGAHCSLVVGDEVSASAAAVSESLVDADRESETIEADVRRADGGTVTAESKFTPLPPEDGEYRGTVGVVRDVSEREARERELERYETVVETVQDGIYAQDRDGRFTMVNGAFCEMTGYGRERLLGAHSTLVHDEMVDEAAVDLADALDDGESATVEFDLQPRAGDPVPVESRFAPYEYDGDTAYTGVVRDVSERQQFEETLTALHDTSRELLDASTRTEVSDVVVGATAETLDLPGVAVYRYDEDESVLARDAASLVDSALREETVTIPLEEDSIAGLVFAEGRTRQFDDVRNSPHIYDGVGDTPIRSALFVPLADHGVLLAGSREVGGIDDETRQLVELLAANAVAAYDRVDREQELRRQRDRLRALDDLNAVVRGINEALVEQSSREEVAEVVCERLAASDSYRFAWFGDVNPKTGAVESEVEVGVEDYLPEIPVTTDPGDDVRDGPISRAVRTQEVQVVEDAVEDPAFEPWREYAVEYDYRSAAAVPVVHDGTLYGLVGVYGEEPDAFGGEQRAVVGQLGTVVGHALASIERKRALMSDEVVEVEFRIRDVFETLGADQPDEGTVRFDQAVPTGDDTYLVYGSADAAAAEGVRALVDGQDHWKDLSVLARDRERVAFEVTVTEPPVVSAVAARGGHLERATIEDGDYHMTLHLPPGGGIRHVIEAVEDAYPAAELLTRRQLSRTDESTEPLGRTVADRLTDRQRAALEAAYYSGYFEWPRDSTGEDVADSLGVTAPTFHQHVRHAQQKLLGVLYEGG